MVVRVEKDLLGSREVPSECLTGIHTLRARENFNLAGRPVNPALVRAMGVVKAAAARVNRELGYLDQDVGVALEKAALELDSGMWQGEVATDALQGGAGTSLNMSVNELISNRALQILGRSLGNYAVVSPTEHANLHQSTNDVVPTALKVAAIRELRGLESAVLGLQEAFQEQEKRWAHVVKVGRTQYQDAVLTTLGRQMGAYADAFARDRWRLSKCEERLRVVNLGGTAIGTGLGAPRKYIFKATDALRDITGLSLARSENLVDATQNLDAFVEVSGILKALASSLLKISGDLRLMSSGPEAGLGEIHLPERQAGSSIMPGKVNPVIAEAVGQAGLKVMANDSLIAHAVGLGSLELNAFVPVIADAFLESIQLLSRACRVFSELCVKGIEAREDVCARHVRTSSVVLTALLPALGYDLASDIAQQAVATGKPVMDVVLARGLMTLEQFEASITPEAVMRLGAPDVRPNSGR